MVVVTGVAVAVDDHGRSVAVAVDVNGETADVARVAVEFGD